MMQNEILKSIISEIAASIIESVAVEQFGSSLGKLRDNLFWERVLSRFFKRLKSGYEDFEKAEKEKLLLLDEDFLSKSIVKEQIKNCALTGEIDKDKLGEIFEQTYGSDSLGLINKNLDDACRLMDSVVMEELPPQDIIIYRRLQSSMQIILASTEQLAQGQNEILDEMSKGFASIPTEGISNKQFPTVLVNEKIRKKVNNLRQSRFFIEFDSKRASLELARKLTEGDLSGGADEVRSKGLAWCARILSTEEISQAEKHLKLAKTLDISPETEIAEAFILSSKENKADALDILARENTPRALTAALMIVTNHGGPSKAIEWIGDAQVKFSDLDSDGKHHLITLYLHLGQWDEARGCLSDIENEDFQSTPILHHDAALTFLMGAVPEEFRPVVLHQIPLLASEFPLGSGRREIELRRSAHEHFLESAKKGEELGLPKTKTVADEYALWLELRDPDDHHTGMQKLKTKLKNLHTALRFVPLAIQFDIDIDPAVVEREIERKIALNGRMTADAAMARLALVFKQQSPNEGAEYISQHFDQLSNHIDSNFLSSLKIEMYIKSGQTERAKKTLEELVERGLPEHEKDRLLRTIDTVKGIDPIIDLKKQFDESGSLADLLNLVGHLETTANRELIVYSEMLFRKTKALRDAVRFASALYNQGQLKGLISFLDENDAIVEQSEDLKLLYCWSLFLDGRLMEAKAKLSDLGEDWNNPRIRKLHVDLNVATGEWDLIAPIISNELKNKDKRNADELLEAALLGLYIKSPSAKELLFAAAEKGSNNANILSSAYFLAATAGWEGEPGVMDWLNKAARLSEDGGPVWATSMREIVEMKPDWDRHESETREQLRSGKIPLFVAAQLLNKSLVDLFLFPALANQDQIDPRRRITIPAYSGKFHSKSLNLGGSVGFGATALLTLGFLDILDVSLDAFSTIFIPHSTLSWLFDEKQKATFHQPSQIANAHKIRNLLATKAINEAHPRATPESDLAMEIGKGLALHIAEAESKREVDGMQGIVVRPYPVHVVASMLEEEADLSDYKDILSSCQILVDRLKQKGHITATEYNKAQDYLKLQEKPWPDQPEITDGATLYLDDLAVSHFLHLGLLDKLQTAGFEVYISQRKVSEANSLILYESISERAVGILEEIKGAIRTRIESGKVIIGGHIKGDHNGEQSLHEHPTYGLFQLADRCDAIVSDDRFMNQHAVVENTHSVPVVSTLDLINKLGAAEIISREERREYLTVLRKSGYVFVPVDDAELLYHLEASHAESGNVIEVAELKAIRENILQVRMGNWLNLPEEATWLKMIQKALKRALKGLWKEGDDWHMIKVRSYWLLGQIDLRGWAHRLVAMEGEVEVDKAHWPGIVELLWPPENISTKARNEYLEWADKTILAPTKEQEPGLYDWLVETRKAMINKAASGIVNEGVESEK